MCLKYWSYMQKMKSVKAEIFGNDRWDRCQKKLKITFFTDAPFIVKFRFE